MLLATLQTSPNLREPGMSAFWISVVSKKVKLARRLRNLDAPLCLFSHWFQNLERDKKRLIRLSNVT